jgi:hypothetical protein
MTRETIHPRSLHIVVDSSIPFNPFGPNEAIYPDRYIGKCVDGIFLGFNIFQSTYSTDHAFVVLFGFCHCFTNKNLTIKEV